MPLSSSQEDEGYNIADMKDNKLYVYASSYLINNDLFIELRAEIKTDFKFYYNKYSSYLTNYILKYNLTNQELKALHSDIYSLAGSTTYLQAPFFIQELSYQKTPEVISKKYVTLDALATAQDKTNSRRFLGSNTHIMTYLGENQIDDIWTESVFQTHPRPASWHCLDTYLYTLKYKGVGKGEHPCNDIKVQICTNYDFYGNIENASEAKETAQPITVLFSYNSRFKSIKYDANIENVI